MIRIVIADDHAIVREGLKRIVGAADDMTVAGEAADGLEVMQLVRELEFDVLVLDLSMPGRSGMELIKLARAEKPQLRILILSMHQEMQYAVRAIKTGASGYLTKESAPAKLVQALRKIAGGGAYISTEVAEQLALGAMPGAAVAPHEALSAREFEVFRLLAGGVAVARIPGRGGGSGEAARRHQAHPLHTEGGG
ncbi:MAG: response regulator transcription factor, partial [Microbacteriaceae bacterium]|nr:response regulator transcription factor [Burkholderiaceae bacterium]